MSRVDRFRAMPWSRKLLVYAASALAFGVGIAYITIITVTLRKAFELSAPWETVEVFLIVSIVLVILWRALGLHETR